jgi:uncharacterized protein YhbP (UPF0306 family)
MTAEQIEQTIREYIPQIVHMSLATCANDQPWVCEVHFAYDDDLNLYFRSTPERRHSQEIQQNPKVAGNIVTQHHKNQKVRGVYFEGTAERLENVDQNHPGVVATAERYGKESVIQALSKVGGPSYYKITVKNWYLFDAYASDQPQKYQLPWSQA